MSVYTFKRETLIKFIVIAVYIHMYIRVCRWVGGCINAHIIMLERKVFNFMVMRHVNEHVFFCFVLFMFCQANSNPLEEGAKC